MIRTRHVSTPLRIVGTMRVIAITRNVFMISTVATLIICITLVCLLMFTTPVC